MENYGFQNYLLVKIQKTYLKIVDLKHRIQFLSVSKKYDVKTKRIENKTNTKHISSLEFFHQLEMQLKILTHS